MLVYAPVSKQGPVSVGRLLRPGRISLVDAHVVSCFLKETCPLNTRHARMVKEDGVRLAGRS